MTAGVVEFDCEGCGVHVTGFGRDTPPASHLCSVCEWFDAAWRSGAFQDAGEMVEAMRLIGHLPGRDDG